MAFSNPTPPPSVPFPTLSARADNAWPPKQKPQTLPPSTDPFQPNNGARVSSGLGNQQAAPYSSSNVIVTNNNTNRTVPVITPNNGVVPTPVRTMSSPTSATDRAAQRAAEMARRRGQMGLLSGQGGNSAQTFTGGAGSPRGNETIYGGGSPRTPTPPVVPQHLALPGQGEVGGAWGAGMYPQWYQEALQQQGGRIAPEQAANQFAQYVRAHPEIDFGWYWNSFRQGGDYYGGQYSF